VDWNNLSSEDGDPDQGSFSFTFDPQAVASTPLSSLTKVAGAQPINTATISAPTQLVGVSASTPAPSSPTPNPAATGGNCLPGMLPVGSLFGVVLILVRRRSAQ